MRNHSFGYLFCFFALIFSTGCLGGKKPKTSPDKPDVNAYLLVPGCDGGKKIKDVAGPLKVYREKMFERNMFFMDSQGRKGEKKILEQCDSVEAIDRFFAQFWGPVRDPDKSTPINEYKEIIDERMLDIENEVFFNDPNIAGTTFRANGGLRGDMANVYLLRGAPHYTAKLENTSRISDMIAWVYFDPSQRPLFVFIFYNKGNGFRVFRNHMVMQTYESFLQVLKEIARIYPTSDEDYNAIYRELVTNDREYIFQYGLERFSYDDDIKIDKVLAPPMPESITAKAIQPKILGVPSLPKDMKLIFSRYNATITGFLTVNKYPDGSYRSKLTIGFSDIDWEDKGEFYDSSFHIMVSFTDEKTREKKEFISGIYIKTSVENYNNNKDKYLIIGLDGIGNQSSGEMSRIVIPDILKSLGPGDYQIKVHLLNLTTLKSGIWYEYITIK